MASETTKATCGCGLRCAFPGGQPIGDVGEICGCTCHQAAVVTAKWGRTVAGRRLTLGELDRDHDCAAHRRLCATCGAWFCEACQPAKNRFDCPECPNCTNEDDATLDMSPAALRREDERVAP